MTNYPCSGCTSRYAYTGDYAGRVYCNRLSCTYKCLLMRVGAVTGFHALGHVGTGEAAYRAFVTQSGIVELVAMWYRVPSEIRKMVDDEDREHLGEQEKVEVRV